MRNPGSEPVVDVNVYVRCDTFDNLNVNGPPVVTFFAGFSSVSRYSPWWNIPKLEPGELKSKSASEILDNFLQNQNVTRRTEEIQARNRGIVLPKNLNYIPIVRFDVSYLRQVDRKEFRIWRSARLYMSSQGNKASLGVEIIPPINNLQDALGSPLPAK